MTTDVIRWGNLRIWEHGSGIIVVMTRSRSLCVAEVGGEMKELRSWKVKGVSFCTLKFPDMKAREKD